MFKLKKGKSRIFMDYASTTPVDKEVFSKMKKYFTDDFYNAQALYKEGLKVRNKLEEARELVSGLVQVKSGDVIFTGGGTESDNMALIGVARAIKEKIKNDLEINKTFTDKKPHIITTNIEHVAVLEACAVLEEEGFDIEYLPVNKDGIITSQQIKKALRPETILVSVMLANNEIGTIFPMREIGNEILKYKKENKRIKESFPYLHTDASQAPNYIDINVDKLRVDMMTLDGSKIYGPKGSGCLIKKNYVPIKSIVFGGKQEFGLRAGTENIPLIYGFALALEKTLKIREQESKRLGKIQKYFFEKIESEIVGAKINGSQKYRLPNNVNLCLPGINSEFVVIALDEKGVSCSAMTACRNLSDNAFSYVVGALETECATSSLRFTMGRNTKKTDVNFVIEKLKQIIEKQV
jgi:cysteine desulfurase